MHVTIDKFGRVVLPKAVRNHLNLQAGSEMEIEQEKEKIILKIIHAETPIKKEGDILIFTGKAIHDISNALSSIREERLESLNGFLR